MTVQSVSSGSSTRTRHQISWDPALVGAGRSASRSAWLHQVDLTRRMRGVLQSPDDLAGDVPWKGQPWLTPILGSGPLGLPTSFLAVASTLPEAIVLKLDRHEVLQEFRAVSADPAIWLDAFATSMVEHRVGDRDPKAQELARAQAEADEQGELRSASDLADDIHELAALLVLVSAQLSRTFHRISLDTCRPISRWGTVTSAMPSNHDRAVPLKDEYLDLLQVACEHADRRAADELRSGAGRETTLRAIQALLEKIRAEAGERRVTLNHLEQITEVAWHFLVESISRDSYPGWTDLLLQLVLAGPDAVAIGARRPRWAEIGTVGSEIRKIIEPAAQWSWTHSGATADSRENRDFYNSVARVLWAQADARAQWKTSAGATDLPQAVAFVTSFDNELEMALWRTAQEGGSAGAGGFQYSVIVPAYAAQSKHAQQADFVWLEGVVKVAPGAAASDYQDIRRVSEWRLVSNRRQDYYRHPVVVRLAGCPLLDLPDLTVPDAHPDLVRDLNLAGLGGTSQVVHSVTVDEYLAMRQLETEWAWNRDSADNAPNRGLPVQYLATRPDGPQRYWTIMGVPFRDPAVRLRVLSILAQQAPTGRADQTARPEAEDAGAEVVQEAPDPTPPPRPDAPGAGTGRRFGKGGQAAAEPAPAPSVRVETATPAADTTSAAVDPGEDGPTAGRRGVAINTRVDDEEMMLLNALGFDVVTDRCERFTDDLREHASWLVDGARVISSNRAGGQS